MLEGSKDQFLWEPEKVKDQSSMEESKTGSEYQRRVFENGQELEVADDQSIFAFQIKASVSREMERAAAR